MERLTQGKKLQILLEEGEFSLVNITTRGAIYKFKPRFGKEIERECDNPFLFINDILKFKRLI